MRAGALAGLVFLFLGALAPAALAQEPPALIVDAPPALSPLLERLRQFDRSRLKAAMRLTGLDDPGQPITVLLAEEGSRLAASAPRWASGFAHAEAGYAVVLPSRIPNYPDTSLEAVVQHEVTHVLIDRAARFHELPRWFHEGVAMASARVWSFEDTTQLAWGVLLGGPADLRALDDAFHGSAPDARAAYALAGALVRELQLEKGPAVTGDILGGVGGGETFEQAFAAAAGEPLAGFAGAFFRKQAFWLRWVPVLTSATTLWLAIVGLFLVAYRRKRRRAAELARQWEADEHAWRRRQQSPAAGPAIEPRPHGGGAGRGGPPEDLVN